MFFFEKPFKATLCVATVLADHPERSTFRRFRDQPVKVGGIIGHEPHAGPVGGGGFLPAPPGLEQGPRFPLGAPGKPFPPGCCPRPAPPPLRSHTPAALP